MFSDLTLRNRNVAPAIAGFRRIDIRNRDLRPGDRFLIGEASAPMGDRTGPELYGVAEVVSIAPTNRRRTFSGDHEYRLTYAVVSGNVRAHLWSGETLVSGDDRDGWNFRRNIRCEVRAAWGPSLLPDGWGYRPGDIRDYSDGLRVQIEWSDQTVASANGCVNLGARPVRYAATVWVAADGIAGGFHRRRIDGPADLSALVAGFRRALVKSGCYPLYSADGVRTVPTSELPALVSAQTRVMNLKSGY